MKRLVIFCGSSTGTQGKFEPAAYRVGELMARKGIGVVYGGASIGLMGAVANGALEAGGEVIGVIPSFLKTVEIEHAGLTEMIVVESMHQRKAVMNELSDGAVALPGGFGTMEELFEILTWAQLGLHAKPIGMLNTHGFYDPLLDMIQRMTSEKFLNPLFQKLLLVSDDMEDLLEQMKNYSPVLVPKPISSPNRDIT